VRGRIKGATAFERFRVGDDAWMVEQGVTVEDVDSVVTPSRGAEEFVLHVSAMPAGSSCRWRSPPTSTRRRT
jgi:hypothetical protein